MKYPKFLNTKNNKIYLIAPSFGCTTEPYASRLEKAIEHFKSNGFGIIEGPNIRSSIGYRSASTKACAKEFMEAYLSSSFLILSVGGGNFECEILDDIDFEFLKDKKPKWFMGYSDNSFLTFTITTMLDVASIYGPCAPEFGQDVLDISLKNTLELIRGNKLQFEGYPFFEKESLKDENHPFLGYNYDTKKEIIAIPDSIKMEGRLLGGCIDCLPYLIGTPYDKVSEFIEKYKEDGIIWFLEACDFEPPMLRLAILHMKRAGWFKNAKGFIFGRSLRMDASFLGIDMYNAITGALDDLGLPIIMDADFGHLKPQIPIICGSYAKIEGHNKGNVKIEYILK